MVMGLVITVVGDYDVIEVVETLMTVMVMGMAMVFVMTLMVTS